MTKLSETVHMEVLGKVLKCFHLYKVVSISMPDAYVLLFFCLLFLE